jgi:N-acetylglutamate synthase-like GNAT family acetyltransferase
MHIRRARPEDEAAIAALIEELALATDSAVAPGLVGRFGRMLSLDHRAVWGAEDEGHLVGVMTGSLRPTLLHAVPSALIDELVVAAQARGRGVGQALVETMVAWASEREASEVEVSAVADNYRARAFCQRCGFAKEALLLELELVNGP